VMMLGIQAHVGELRAAIACSKHPVHATKWAARTFPI